MSIHKPANISWKKRKSLENVFEDVSAKCKQKTRLRLEGALPIINRRTDVRVSKAAQGPGLYIEPGRLLAL